MGTSLRFEEKRRFKVRSKVRQVSGESLGTTDPDLSRSRGVYHRKEGVTEGGKGRSRRECPGSSRREVWKVSYNGTKDGSKRRGTNGIRRD